MNRPSARLSLDERIGGLTVDAGERDLESAMQSVAYAVFPPVVGGMQDCLGHPFAGYIGVEWSGVGVQHPLFRYEISFDLMVVVNRRVDRRSG